MNRVIVSGSFDDLRSHHVRFLEEAARLGAVHVLLWSDDVVQALEGRAPKFPQAERKYYLEAIRYTSQVTLIDHLANPDCLPLIEVDTPAAWVVQETAHSHEKQAFCQANGIGYQVIADAQLKGFSPHQISTSETVPGRKKVLVTGCYDWLHSGHVRFFEEVSQLGDLYVVVGNDENVRFLKGAGHPLIAQDERRYMVQAIRYVTETLVSSGMGWMDAEPEIARIKPEMYAVNEDGDKPEKRAFCAEHGLEYVVLKRVPKEGLPRRESTKLRGF